MRIQRLVALTGYGRDPSDAHVGDAERVLAGVGWVKGFGSRYGTYRPLAAGVYRGHP